jgi:transposase-like protein
VHRCIVPKLRDGAIKLRRVRLKPCMAEVKGIFSSPNQREGNKAIQGLRGEVAASRRGGQSGVWRRTSITAGTIRSPSLYQPQYIAGKTGISPESASQ